MIMIYYFITYECLLFYLSHARYKKVYIKSNLKISYMIIQNRKVIKRCLSSHTNKQFIYLSWSKTCCADLIGSQHWGSEPPQNLHRTTWLQVVRESEWCQTDRQTHTHKTHTHIVNTASHSLQLPPNIKRNWKKQKHFSYPIYSTIIAT